MGNRGCSRVTEHHTKVRERCETGCQSPSRRCPLGLFKRVYSISFEPKSLVWYDESGPPGPRSWPRQFHLIFDVRFKVAGLRGRSLRAPWMLRLVAATLVNFV